MSMPALLLAATLATATLPAAAQTPASTIASAAQGTLLTVHASGEASRTPDLATISAGVVTQAADAAGAMRANAQRMQHVMEALARAGISGRDVQTSGITLQPQYRYADNQPPAITGFEASNTVSVKVREPARLGAVLDALIAQGANRIDGPSFGIDQPDAAYAEARQAAIRRALAQAETYADALGVKLRRIVSITEGGAASPRPVPMLRALAGSTAAAPPVAVGESALAVNVEVVFELGH